MQNVHGRNFRTITIAGKNEAVSSGPIEMSELFQLQLAMSELPPSIKCPHSYGGFIELYLPLQNPRTRNIGIPKVSQV